MRKIANLLVLTLAAIALAALFALTRVDGAPRSTGGVPADLPPDVQAENWRHISDDLGLLLRPAAKPRVVVDPAGIDVTFPPQQPYVEGVFMARVDGEWRVVSPVTPARDELRAGRLEDRH